MIRPGNNRPGCWWHKINKIARKNEPGMPDAPDLYVGR